MRIIYVVTFALLLTGCNQIETGLTRPGPIWQQWMYDGPPPGQEYPPLYVLGWQHGCETGVAANANHYYKFYLRFRQDWQLAQNTVYYRGWRDAFDYCQRYMFEYLSRRTF